MRARAIVVRGSEQSEESWAVLQESHKQVGNEFDLVRLDAITPGIVEGLMLICGVKWKYPWDQGEDRIVDGCKLHLHRYRTRNRLARMACFMSHYQLWKEALDGPVLILEDDAEFILKLDPGPLLESPYQIIGINCPLKATRKDELFHQLVQSQCEEIRETPWIDEPHVPQGIAGASAYLVKPKGAEMALDLVKRHGAWPNDAILCKQILPGVMGVTKTYYTRVQETPTTL